MNAPMAAATARQTAAEKAPLGIFAVNLDRSQERWRDIQRYFGHFSWPLYRVAAVDAVKDPAAALAVRGQTMDMPPIGIGWNPYRFRLFVLVEEACFASHMLAWKQFLASGHERGLILEDDSVPFDTFEEAVGALLASGPAHDIVKLEGIYRPGGRLAVPLRSLGPVELVRSFRPCSGAAAYILTRDAAKRLIDSAGSLRMPVDDFIWSRGIHRCDIVHVSPWLVMQSGAPSTMAGDRRPSRHVKLRDPVRVVTQALRRFGLRLSLWWNAMQGRPWTLLAARKARWVPEAYDRQEEAAPAARN